MTEGILFATPMYGGQCTEKFFYSAQMTTDVLKSANVAHDWLSGRHESLIHRGRMELARTFLDDSDYSHLMWIDADMEWAPGDVASLWNLQADVAVGFYAMKRPDMPLSAWKDGKLVRLEDCPKEPFEVDMAGTGFMLISRKCIERVIEVLRGDAALGHQMLNDIQPRTEMEGRILRRLRESLAFDFEGADQKRVPALFMTPIHNDGLESEDYFFCRMVREAGMKIIGVPSLNLGHYGQTRYGRP